jgi:hypothetical protein
LLYLRHAPLWKSLSYADEEIKKRKKELESNNTSPNAVFQFLKDKESHLLLFCLVFIAITLLILYAKASFLKFNKDEKPLFKGHLKVILTERTIPIIAFSALITTNLFF